MSDNIFFLSLGVTLYKTFFSSTCGRIQVSLKAQMKLSYNQTEYPQNIKHSQKLRNNDHILWNREFED